MTLVQAVKSMARTNFVMVQLGIEERRLARNLSHVEKLREKQRDVDTEDNIILYHELTRWELEVADAEEKVNAWKAELAISRTQYFSQEEVAELKEEGALAALLNQLERAEASKIPYMLEKNGADFIQKAKLAIKCCYFWNGVCPW